MDCKFDLKKKKIFVSTTWFGRQRFRCDSPADVRGYRAPTVRSGCPRCNARSLAEVHRIYSKCSPGFSSRTFFWKKISFPRRGRAVLSPVVGAPWSRETRKTLLNSSEGRRSNRRCKYTEITCPSDGINSLVFAAHARHHIRPACSRTSGLIKNAHTHTPYVDGTCGVFDVQRTCRFSQPAAR